MKRFWLSFGVLVIMLSAALGNAVYVDTVADSVTGGLREAEELADRGEWGQARELTRQSFGRWEDCRTYLHIVSRHSDLDEILVSFRAVLQYLELEEMDQYAAENRELVTHIELLAEMEQPDWLNVL